MRRFAREQNGFTLSLERQYPQIIICPSLVKNHFFHSGRFCGTSPGRAMEISCSTARGARPGKQSWDVTTKNIAQMKRTAEALPQKSFGSRCRRRLQPTRPNDSSAHSCRDLSVAAPAEAGAYSAVSNTCSAPFLRQSPPGIGFFDRSVTGLVSLRCQQGFPRSEHITHGQHDATVSAVGTPLV